jgi:hypothetical protein
MVIEFISKFINKLKTKSTLKWTLSLAIIVGMIYIIVAVLNNNNGDYDKPTSVKPYLNQNKISVDSNLSYIVQVDKDTFLTVKAFDSDLKGLGTKYKSINTYDIKSGEEKPVITTNNYISHNGIASSKDWVVWIEVDTLEYDPSNKAFNWSMMAKNLNSEEKIEIDKSDFTSNNYNVPMFIEYIPIEPKISNNNILVYSKTVPNGNKIASVLVCYDLNTKTQKIHDRTEDVTEELIHTECAIYDNIIAWSKFYQLNEYPYEKRFTQYVYGDIFTYNLNTEEIEQLTFDDFFYQPDIYENKLVAVRVPENKENQITYNSEIVLFDLKSKEFSTIVDENSPIYLKREDEMDRCRPIINKKYISWQNGSFPNRYIYDHNKNRFLEIYENLEKYYISSNIKDAMVSTINLFEDYVMVRTQYWEKGDTIAGYELVELE